jgi:hypothetical protein
VYKYLGVELDNRLLLKEFKRRLFSKAYQNMSKVWAMGMNTGYLSIKAGVNLWESLVRSIVEYAVEIWGDEVWKEGENLLHEMGRRILRCSPAAANAAIRGELGFWSMRSRRDLKKMYYFAHILSVPEDSLVRQAYYMSRNTPLKTNWAGRIKSILGKYGLGALWTNEQGIWNLDGKGNNEAKNRKEHRRFIRTFLFKKVLVREEKMWGLELVRKPKLRTYMVLKNPRLRMEKYLLTPGFHWGRTLMTDIRVGTNRLEIEKGRREKKAPEYRFCRQCKSTTQVEDERHFVTGCPKFAEERKTLFEKIELLSGGKWKLQDLSPEHQFLILLCGTGDALEEQLHPIFQKFLVKAFRKRV